MFRLFEKLDLGRFAAWAGMVLFLSGCTQLNPADLTRFKQAPHGEEGISSADLEVVTAVESDQEYDPSVQEDNYTKVLYGKKKTAVILVHGFMGSPFEVYYLGREIHKKGYTVYMPLVKGFGGNTDLANATPYTAWQQTLETGIKRLSPFYPNIILAGFSMGGTIVTDFLVQDNGQSKNIKGAVLMAPYYSPNAKAAVWLNWFMGLFKETVSLETIYKFQPSPDMFIPMSNPGYYNDALPMKAADQIIKLGKRVQKDVVGKKIPVPVLLVYTEFDQTVDNNISLDLAEKHFENAQIVAFEKDQKVVHQVALPVGNGSFDTLKDAVIGFIEK